MNPIEKTLERHKKANKKIEAAAANMRKLYRDARLTINDKIQKAVMRSNDPLAGKGLIQLIESLSGAYGDLEQSFREEFDRAIPYVAEAYAHDALKDLGETILGKVDKNRIELFRRDAFAHVAGATTAMEKTDVAFLRQASADVFREAALTGITRKEASKNLLGQLMSRPDQFRFTDAAGKVWNNETYCDMLGRTVLLNVGRQTYLDTCADQGKDVVRVTVSGNPCPDCAVFENTLLSLTGATKGLRTIDEATAAGLLHPNCTHSFVAVGDYVQKKQFDESGRPKSGLNAEGNEQTSEPEDWRTYRQDKGISLRSPTFKTEDYDGVTVQRLTVGGDKIPKGTPEDLALVYRAAEKDIESAMDMIRSERVEYSISTTASGNITEVTKGGVSATHPIIPKGGKLIHNHPDGATFSIEDITGMFSKDLSEMTVVTSGEEFRLIKQQAGEVITKDTFFGKLANLPNGIYNMDESNMKLHRTWEHIFNGTRYTYTARRTKEKS